jgi:hypothetical protein
VLPLFKELLFEAWTDIQLKYKELYITEGTVLIMVTKNKYSLQGSNTSGPQSLFPDQIVDLLDEAQLFVCIVENFRDLQN